MKRLLLLGLLFALSHSMQKVDKKSKKALLEACEKIMREELTEEQKSILFMEKIKRKILEAETPNFLAEAQMSYNHELQKLEEHQVKWHEKVDNYRQDRKFAYEKSIRHFNKLKEKVKGKFGQDIFLAPANDIDVRRIKTYHIAFIQFEKNFLIRDSRDQKYSEDLEKKINSFKNPKKCEQYFALFKLKNISSMKIAQEICRRKMNKE